MPAQIVFLTLFLGITSGTQQVALQVSGPVKMVMVLLGGHEVARMTQPPWSAVVEFGPELTPRELTAIGFDERGGEIARVTQILNLPRPTAELEIVTTGDGASLRWRHLMNAKPSRSRMTLDGKPLTLDASLHARLPRLDRETPHVIAAEIRFEDGFMARRELVLESDRNDSTGTQLTPVLVRQTSPKIPTAWHGCLTAASARPVRIAALEKPRALVIVVRDPDPHDAQLALDPAGQRRFAIGAPMRNMIALDRDTVQRLLWPVTERHEIEEHAASVLFHASYDVDATDLGMVQFLILPGPTTDDPLRFADAVAVAGLRAITGGQRRAVVLVLSRKDDASVNGAAAVRRYLATIGVPLFVWSFSGPRPELAATWGEVDDIANVTKLAAAVNRIRRTLDEQRIAWLDVDPLTALEVKPGKSCGIEPVAGMAP